jgi:hypothetical protein
MPEELDCGARLETRIRAAHTSTMSFALAIIGYSIVPLLTTLRITGW